MPSMLSSFMQSKKQLDIWGRGQPLLNKVGVAWVKSFWDMRW
jgi:hypothetical protein